MALVPDVHVRRSGDDYAIALANLLPSGQAWPRAPTSVLQRTIRGLAQIFGFVDSRAADLLEQESDPRITLELLSDWERNWGLPDPCFFGEQHSIGMRHQILMLKMTLLGAQSRAFYIEVASWLGYTITITEYAPFMCAISMCGDTSQQELEAGGPPATADPGLPTGGMRWYIGNAEQRYSWTVHVTGARLTWFRCGSGGGQTGVDTHLEIGRALDLECLLNRWKPAHTVLLFDYSGELPDDPFEGTP